MSLPLGLRAGVGIALGSGRAANAETHLVRAVFTNDLHSSSPRWRALSRMCSLAFLKVEETASGSSSACDKSITSFSLRRFAFSCDSLRNTQCEQCLYSEGNAHTEQTWTICIHWCTDHNGDWTAKVFSLKKICTFTCTPNESDWLLWARASPGLYQSIKNIDPIGSEKCRFCPQKSSACLCLMWLACISQSETSLMILWNPIGSA